jgi:acyl carrier protein
VSVEAKVRKYIADNFLFSSDTTELRNDASLLDMGLIDSTGILEIILFLEEQFGVKVDNSEMVPENLDSVNNIVRFVETRLAKQ